MTQEEDPRVIKYALEHFDEIMEDLKKEGWFTGSEGKYTMTEKFKKACHDGTFNDDDKNN